MPFHQCSSIYYTPIRDFPENCVYKHDGRQCRWYYYIHVHVYMDYLHGKLLTANFLSYDIDSAKKSVYIGIAYKNNKFLVL